MASTHSLTAESLSSLFSTLGTADFMQEFAARIQTRKPSHSQSLSQETQRIARTLLAQSDLPRERAANFVYEDLSQLFWYADMPREEALGLLDWGLPLGREHGLDMPLSKADGGQSEVVQFFRCGLPPLFTALNAPDLLAQAERHRIASSTLFETYRARVQHLPARERWLAWHPFFTRYPEAYLAGAKAVLDPGLVELRWKTRPSRALAGHMLEMLRGGSVDKDYLFEVMDRMIYADPTPFVKQFDHEPLSLSPAFAQHLLAARHDALLASMLKAVNVLIDKYFNTYREVIRAALLVLPSLLSAVDANGLVRLLPLLAPKASPQQLAALAEAAKGSGAKSLRAALVQWAKAQPLRALQDAGWWKKPTKNMALTLRDILLAHPDASAAAALLQQMLDHGVFDAASASVVQAWLQQAGIAVGPQLASQAAESAPDHDTTPSTPRGADLASIEAKAASVKRIAATTKRFDEPAALALLAPLSAHAARVVFHLAATAEGELPPLWHELWRQIPTAQQAELALLVAQSWIASGGEPKLNWCLQLVGTWADARSVDVLRATVQGWGKDKTKRQRASIAAEQIGLTDSAYALARLHQLSTATRIKTGVAKAARHSFAHAAARKGLTPGELHDALTLDGGAEQAALAKLIARQFPQRMQEAFQCGRTWPLARWQPLFAHHPILRALGHSLIWRVDEGSALAHTSFRIAEDFSLVDLTDQAPRLPADARIGLWHPALALAGEAEAWHAHLADHALTPLFDQTGAPAELPTASQYQADALIPQGRIANTTAAVRRALARCGYSQGWNDGLYSYLWHDCFLPFEQFTMRIQHSHCVEGGDDDVEIEGVAIYAGDAGKQALAPANWPKPLLATAMGHLEKIRNAPTEPDESGAPLTNTRRGNNGFLLVEFGFDTDSEDFDTLVEALSQAKHNGDRAADAYLGEVLARQTATVRGATQDIMQHDWFWDFDAEIGWQFDHAQQITRLELEYRKPLTRAQVDDVERWARAGGALRVVSH